MSNGIELSNTVSGTSVAKDVPANRDPDCYPEKLCRKCASELKNAHFLIEKALESFRKLQDLFKTEGFVLDIPTCSNSDSLIEFQIETFDKNSSAVIYSVDDVTLLEHIPIDVISESENENNISKEISMIEIEKVKHNNSSAVICPMDDVKLTEQIPNETVNQIISESEDEINMSNEVPMIENILIESEHFTNIENNESFDEPLLDTELLSLANKEYRRKHFSLQTFPEPANRKKQRNGGEKKPKQVSNYQSKNTPEENALASNCSLNQNENKPSETEKTLDSAQTKRKKKKYILICQYCSLETDGPSQLKRHEATHNENRERIHACKICGLKVYTLATLNEHMKTHEENRQKTRKCEFCEKAFFSTGALNVHRRRHLGLMFKCKMCSKEYYRQVDLDKHLLKHSTPPGKIIEGQRKYVVQCQYCNKSVYTDKWKGHEAAHLGKPQVKCKVCDKDFFSRTRCTKHLRQVHRKPASEYDDLIHYYVKRTDTRVTNLLLKQKLIVKPLTE